MTRLLVLLWMMLGLSAVAQDQTDVIPTLTIKGTTYNNVRITSFTPVDAIVVYDGGGLRAKWTDLPESLRKKYGYDPVKAEKYLAMRNQRKTAPTPETTPKPPVPPVAAREPAPPKEQPPVAVKQPELVADPSAPQQRMRVISIVATNIYARCLVSMDGSQQEILLDRLPPAVKQSFEGLYSLQRMITEFSDKVKADKKKAEVESAAAPELVNDNTDLRKFGERINQRRQAESDLLDAQREEKDLAQMKSYLKTMEEQNQKTANIVAAPTGKTLAGAAIWKCIGQAQ